jgi:hypothetical protein
MTVQRVVLRVVSVSTWVLLQGACTTTRIQDPEQEQSGASSDVDLPPATNGAAGAPVTNGDRPRDTPPAPDRNPPPSEPPSSVPSTTPPRMVQPPPPRDAGVIVEPPAPTDAGTIDPPQEPVACADQAPPHLSQCAAEGELCARWTTDPATGYDQYFACQCRAKTSTSLVWDCYENGGGGLACPHETQQDGSSCYGYKSSTCPYPPLTYCECPVVGDDPRWSCTEAETPLAPTTAVDPEKLVRDLEDADRVAWCEWFLQATVAPGFPLPPDVAPTPDGYYPDRGCMGCAGGVAVDGMIPPGLPVSACVTHLTLSTCEATVAELNDCTRSMIGGHCWPQPRGCARYFETPGCAGTIASRGAQCPIQLE